MFSRSHADDKTVQKVEAIPLRSFYKDQIKLPSCDNLKYPSIIHMKLLVLQSHKKKKGDSEGF
jgi:hypothetical protein